MRVQWLLLPLVVVLAIAAWISGLDTTGDPATTWLLCSASIGAASLFLLK